MKIKLLFSLIAFISIQNVFAEAKELNFNFNNEEMIKAIDIYSSLSGQKFVIDPSVRGKITILNNENVTIQEAYNQLSLALALNGYAISRQGDLSVIHSARNVQRNFIEVSTEKPSLTPERMYTWIYQPKNVTAEQINKDLRILVSKDGEMSVSTYGNKLIISDWVTNINRIALILSEIDKKVDGTISKNSEVKKNK